MALRLTAREQEILDMAASGLTDKEICQQLCLALPTVRTHWVRMRRKLGVVNRSQAVAVGHRSTWASTPKTLVQRAVEEVQKDQLAFCVWQPSSHTALVDATTRALFGIEEGEEQVPAAKLLEYVWPLDRPRVSQYLLQCAHAKPMTPIEFRVHPGRSFGNVVRIVKLASTSCQEFGRSVLLAATVEPSLPKSRAA